MALDWSKNGGILALSLSDSAMLTALANDYNFEGCFLTGTAAEITPVSKIDKFNFKVCELIKDLSISYQNIVRKKSAA